MQGREIKANLTVGNSGWCIIAGARLSACASTAGTGEEPGAVVPHAGICAGGGRATALPTATVA